MTAAYEIKALSLTKDRLEGILAAHGARDYLLVFIVYDFSPAALQAEGNAVQNTLCLRMYDFFAGWLAHLVIASGETVDSLILALIRIYNEQFCEEIEQDQSIKVTLATP
jgi:hypothetical protein